MPLIPLLHRVVNRENLTPGEASDAMLAILSGTASSAEIAAFLVALRMKGETVDELTGFARAMRLMAAPVDAGTAGEPLLDTCGTGGGGPPTFNISTVAAFVIAGAGVRVAKHGNRAISGRCGSADLLEALGVRIAPGAEAVSRCVREVGIGFLFAPAMHQAMKHAQPVRADLKMRTVFNLLGPLTNPARANVQVVGAPSPEAAELMARALVNLGLERGFVVHGSDGLDEVTTTGETLLFEVKNGAAARRTAAPEEFGVSRAHVDELRGGDLAANAAIAREVLEGARGPRRDIVVVNAAAGLVAAGRARDFREGAEAAAKAIDSGAAAGKLEALAAVSRMG
jgi:anthranilate phosphoribosyltransferase